MTVRRALVGVAATLLALGTGVHVTAPDPAVAETASRTVLLPVRDAWFATSPACAQVPLACGSAPTVTSYPQDTLHVGLLGQEAARAYLEFDTRAVRDPLGGLLVIPVDQDAGTDAPEAASVTACLVRTPLAEAAGEAPAADCAVSSIGAYLPGDPGTVSFDLGPFLAAPGATLTVALLPTPLEASSAPAASWHVAFSSVRRAGTSVPPASAEVDVRPAGGAAPPTVPTPGVLTPPVGVPVVPGSGLPGLAPGVAPPVALPSASPEAAAGPVAAPLTPAARRSAVLVVPGGRYGSVWALPLGLLLVGWAVRATGGRELRSFAPASRGTASR